MLRKRLTTTAAAALVWALAMPPASAAPLNITDTPLFLSVGIKPNLIMAIDDSGSMDGELLLPGNDGAAWWRRAATGTCAGTGDSFTGCVANATGTSDMPGAGRLNFNFAGGAGATWKKYVYLFPNGYANSSTTDRRRYPDDDDDHYAIPPLPQFAWSRSPLYNGAYFDPTEKYAPWPSGGGFTFANATPTAARYDPVFNEAGTINLTADFAGTTSVGLGLACSDAALGNNTTAHYHFRVFNGMTIPAGTCIRTTVAGHTAWETVRTSYTCQVGVNNGCNVTLSGGGPNQAYTLPADTSIGVRYFPATFYLSTATAPSGFGYTGTPASVGLAPDGTTLYQYEIKPGNFAVAADYTAAIQNFANWFSYYRKRHLALRAGLGTAFLTLAGTRVAGFRINETAAPTGPDVTMGDIDNAANRTALYTNFYQNWTGNGGTPNRQAVANLIRNFKRTNGGAPVTASCQRNFGMLFTDGFSNPPGAGDGINGVAGNADGTAGTPYQDAVSDTLADSVWNAYSTPLRTGTGFPLGKVSVPAACATAGHDASLDCETDLHMNFYAITLGTRGLQFNPDSPVDPYVTAPTWPTTFPARHPSAVDDIWHATINGRGQLLNAASSSQLASKLSAVLQSITDKVGSASSAAVNSGSINSGTRLFQASFDSADWSGKLTARSVGANAALGTEVSATLPVPNSRTIIAVTGTGTPVPFRWGNIGPIRQAQLQPTDLLGSNRLDWLRGVQVDEAPAANNFRKRTVLLGDIINSAPAYVGAPAFRYPDSLESAPYSAFRAAQQSRIHMVYTGGNDGMLHGFFSNDSSPTGVVEEKLAFIPSAVFGNLRQLTSPTYAHQYFVDGTPVTGDAFVGGAWRTMLVAGLNKGGQGIYALDVTNPGSFSEGSAASIFKWEFSDADDVDLGFTYSRPSIVRMNNGVWAAGFGNGYNNTVADGRPSTTGNAVLYIRNLATGANIAKIDTGVGTANDPAGTGRPNGLSTPVFVDIDGDSDVDYAYAGDLFGNLWKFNLSSAAPGSWSVANAAPLFSARDGGGTAQPITSRPNVSRGPRGQGLVVVFGTGKYLENTDTDSTFETQSFYALLDPNTGATTDRVTGRAALTQQTILSEIFLNTADSLTDLRITSANVPAATSRGWYIDLVPSSGAQGEMQVTDSLIRNGHVVFTTLVPNTNPCEFGGSSWLMEMDLFTGVRLNNTPFDLNNNGVFDDRVSVGGVDTAVTGVRTTVGITPKPAPLNDEKCDYLIFPGTSGGIETRCRDPGPRGSGRQSWRQAH